MLSVETNSIKGGQNIIDLNINDIEKELEWLKQLINARMEEYFEKKITAVDFFRIIPPDFSDSKSNYADLVNHYQMSMYERVVLFLSLVPHIKPQLLDIFLIKNPVTGKRYTEIGGISKPNFTGLIPTAETAMFILAGDSLVLRMNLLHLFKKEHYLFSHSILQSNFTSEDSMLTIPLVISDEYLTNLTTGENYKPTFSTSFPAQQITTELNWDDLVIGEDVSNAINEMNIWLELGRELLSKGRVGSKIKKGFRSLFHGPPGTGKTLTASLIGKASGLDVYRIDLSMVVSKYIGETEKNLAKVFDMAENKNWILFFDEADALFGKRTVTKDSNDRYANQEVSYLLQRIEDYPGLIILASNFKSNLDDAFYRRFQSVVYFPLPDAEQRYRLWKKAFEEDFSLAPDVNLRDIAIKYELTGGAIMNVLRYCALLAMKRGDEIILLNDIIDGIRKEKIKEGKVV